VAFAKRGQYCVVFQTKPQNALAVSGGASVGARLPWLSAYDTQCRNTSIGTLNHVAQRAKSMEYPWS
jgi:hypothetical protein